jgi:hypothetical protein
VTDATWGDLFERAPAVDAERVRTAVAEARERRVASVEGDADGEFTAPPGESSPARVVADADVLVADLLVGGAAREALDRVREHSWVVLVASDPLLADAERAIRDLAGDDLAADWRRRVDREREPVSHPPGDHPGLAAAYRGGAAHLLTVAGDLTSARAGLGMAPHLAVSVREPRAFATVFDAAGLYATLDAGEYPGPDRDPRE